MSKKRGLSIEEKRERMLELFYDKKDFFLLKELEKIAFKEKGIVSQSVKDVVQSLVDDDMINSDKIGSSVYFWAFPSSASVAKKRKLAELRSKTLKCNDQKDSINGSLIDLYKGRKESPTRSKNLKRYFFWVSRK